MPVVEKKNRKDEKMVGMERRRNTVSLQLVAESYRWRSLLSRRYDLDCLLV